MIVVVVVVVVIVLVFYFQSKEERDLLQIEIETVKNELDLTRRKCLAPPTSFMAPPLLVRLKETADELLEVKGKLENIDKQSMNIINHEGN